jgi:kinesin family protein 22
MEVQSCSVKTPKSLQTKPMDPSCTSKVRVIVRVRPFLSHEIPAKNGNPSSCISVLDPDPDSRDEVTVHLQDPDTRSVPFLLLSLWAAVNNFGGFFNCGFFSFLIF